MICHCLSGEEKDIQSYQKLPSCIVGHGLEIRPPCRRTLSLRGSGFAQHYLCPGRERGSKKAVCVNLKPCIEPASILKPETEANFWNF
jgi:hypothetical protein